jgi:hypothetical protein
LKAFSHPTVLCIVVICTILSALTLNHHFITTTQMRKKAIFLTTVLFVAINSFTHASTLPRDQLSTLKRPFATRGGSILAIDNEKLSNNTSSIVKNSTLFSYAAQTRDSEKAGNGDVATGSKALKVLFLSADTGGGHRASAESLANQVCPKFPMNVTQKVDMFSNAMHVQAMNRRPDFPMCP